MKKVLLLSILLTSLVLLMADLSGCNGSSGSTYMPAPTPPTPTPTPTPTPSNAINIFAFLRADGGITGSATAATEQQRQTARRAAKLAHTSLERTPITVDSGTVNIYVWPGWIDSAGYWDLGTEKKVTSTPGAYSAVHLSPNGTSMVYSAVVNGYNQIFTSTVPAKATAMESPLQLTTDVEHHWVPHISADGSRIVFTKHDAASNGDVVCMIDNALGATESCLDFSATTPMLKGGSHLARELGSEQIDLL